MFFAKIPRHTSQNAITEGDLECILTRNCEGTEQLRIIILFRAQTVCAAYTSSPRGVHPRGACYVIGISYHIKKIDNSDRGLSIFFCVHLSEMTKSASYQRYNHFYQSNGEGMHMWS